MSDNWHRDAFVCPRAQRAVQVDHYIGHMGRQDYDDWLALNAECPAVTRGGKDRPPLWLWKLLTRIFRLA